MESVATSTVRSSKLGLRKVSAARNAGREKDMGSTAKGSKLVDGKVKLGGDS